MIRAYIIALLERATKSAAQAALLVWGADQVNAFNVNYQDVAGFAAGAFVLSVLTSVAFGGFGTNGPAAFGSEAVSERFIP